MHHDRALQRTGHRRPRRLTAQPRSREPQPDLRCKRGVHLARLALVALTTIGACSAPPGAIAPIEPTTVPRAAHTATLLDDGRVLLVGGCTTAGCGGQARGADSEFFDPDTRRFSSGPPMTVPRAGHTATSLEDGRVLFTGGYAAEGRPPHASAELYDPASDTFSPTGGMIHPRGSHTATLLTDGRVLIVGGHSGEGVVDTVEIYDPATGRFRAVASLPGPRATHAATRLPDGSVLVVGGQNHQGDLVPGALRYHPDTDTWNAAGTLAVPRYKHAIVADGASVFAMGGSGLGDSQARLASIEAWDPDTNSWSIVGHLEDGRFKIPAAATVLADGRILIAGDAYTATVFDPGSGESTPAEGSLDARALFATATRLADGRVLVVGGYDSTTVPLAAAYLFEP